MAPRSPLVSIRVIGAEQAVVGLKKVVGALRDLRPFWTDVFAPKFFAEVQDRFKLQGVGRDALGRFQGQPWPQLSPAYRVWKSRHFPGKPILQRTERLRESMVWDGQNPGPEGIFEAYPTYAIGGTSVPYSPHHMQGTPVMPARRFMTDPDAAKWGALLRDWIAREGGKKGKA